VVLRDSYLPHAYDIRLRLRVRSVVLNDSYLPHAYDIRVKVRTMGQKYDCVCVLKRAPVELQGYG